MSSEFEVFVCGIIDVDRFGATWEDFETLSMKLLPQSHVIQDTRVSLKEKGSTRLTLVMRCCILFIPKGFPIACSPQTVPQKRREPGYASLLDTRRPDPGYETVTGRGEKRRTSSYGPRSFPPDDYESVHPKEPGYETLEEGRREDYRSLEPGYEVLPDVRGNGMEVQYSRVNKKGGRAAPKHPSPPRSRHYSGSEVNYETLPEPQTRGGLSDEGGYETIPANERDQRVMDPLGFNICEWRTKRLKGSTAHWMTKRLKEEYCSLLILLPQREVWCNQISQKPCQD